ncbi:predicted protein [Postia placenta Mad-698-R]|nr:predicted protein [Postia placenta Mad-698-R]
MCAYTLLQSREPRLMERFIVRIDLGVSRRAHEGRQAAWSAFATLETVFSMVDFLARLAGIGRAQLIAVAVAVVANRYAVHHGGRIELWGGCGMADVRRRERGHLYQLLLQSAGLHQDLYHILMKRCRGRRRSLYGITLLIGTRWIVADSRPTRCWNNGANGAGAFVHGRSDARKGQSRSVHTVRAVVLYYDRGLRPPTTRAPELASSFLITRGCAFQHSHAEGALVWI